MLSEYDRMFNPPVHTADTPYPIHRPVVEISTKFDEYDDDHAPSIEEIFGMPIKDVLDKSYYDKVSSGTHSSTRGSSKGSKSSGKRK